jgi:hypothetical protein
MKGLMGHLYAALKGRSSTVAPLTRSNEFCAPRRYARISSPSSQNRARRGPGSPPRRAKTGLVGDPGLCHTTLSLQNDVNASGDMFLPRSFGSAQGFRLAARTAQAVPFRGPDDDFC